MTRHSVVRRSWWGLALTPLLLAACSSGSGTGSAGSSPSSTIKGAGVTVQSHIDHYRSAVKACSTQKSPVTCLESADRTLGGQIHTYANTLVTTHGFKAPAADLTDVRNKSQSVANSLEILGDAQPTQANYDRVRNNFNLSSAIDQLSAAITKLENNAG